MFSQRIKELRQKKDISQLGLAKQIGFSQQAVAKWETDRATPSPETLARIAEFFNVSADYLIGTTDDPMPSSAKKTPPGFITPEDVMEMAEQQKGRPLTADERTELLIRAQDLRATILRLTQEDK
jgi:transcriptional regulator with XRE-family HTH domain